MSSKLWLEEWLTFLDYLRRSLPDERLDALDAKLPAVLKILKQLPRAEAYLNSAIDLRQFNHFSDWHGRSLGDADIGLRGVVTRLIHLSRLAAPGILSLYSDSDFNPDSSGHHPPVSIIIPAWNQWAMTAGALESLREKTRYPEFEVIVVDNGSEDDTPEALRLWEKKWDRLRVIRNDRNLGFSAANNQGVEAARNEHLIFLNNDVEICAEDWIDRMMDAFFCHPRCGAAGQFCVIDCFENERPAPETPALGAPEALTRPAYYQKIYFEGLSVPVGWIAGYNLLTTRAILKQAGSWRGDLYGLAGYEDIHLGYAIRATGRFCVTPPGFISVRHLIGQTRQKKEAAEVIRAAAPGRDKYAIFRDHFAGRHTRPNLFLPEEIQPIRKTA